MVRFRLRMARIERMKWRWLRDESVGVRLKFVGTHPGTLPPVVHEYDGNDPDPDWDNDT